MENVVKNGNFAVTPVTDDAKFDSDLNTAQRIQP